MEPERSSERTTLVRSLTTAACVRLVAGLGIAVGQGLYILAGGTTVIALIVLVRLNRIEGLIPTLSYHTVTVQGWAGHRLLGVALGLDQAKDEATLVLHVRVRGKPQAARVGQDLLALPGVTRVKWGLEAQIALDSLHRREDEGDELVEFEP